MKLDFAPAAPGQEHYQGTRRIERVSEAERLAIPRRINEVDEGVAHEANGNVLLPIELLFERQDDEHLLDRFADRADAPSAPRPHLRADVIDDGNTPGA